MTYRERLPNGCPPPEAEEVKAARDLFRLVDSNPPTDDDFVSHRALHPGKTFSDECRAWWSLADYDILIRCEMEDA